MRDPAPKRAPASIRRTMRGSGCRFDPAGSFPPRRFFCAELSAVEGAGDDDRLAVDAFFPSLQGVDRGRDYPPPVDGQNPIDPDRMSIPDAGVLLERYACQIDAERGATRAR